jgi:hypothetical protein
MYNKLMLLLVAIATISLSSFGQAPEGFKYQAVVRDAGNTILNNQAVGMQMTIQQGSIGGTTVYQETFAPTTNAYGLVNLEIGSGTVVSGDFTTIDWSVGPYFIETAVDVTGGTNYTVMGTSQLMSVPYALYAKTSGSSTPGPAGPMGNDGQSAYEVWIGLGNTGSEADFINSLTGPSGSNGTNGNSWTSNILDPMFPGSTVGNQYLNTTSGDVFEWDGTSWNGTGNIKGSDGLNGNDGAVGPQGPSGADGQGGVTSAGSNVTVTGTGISVDPYIISTTDNVNDADADPANELQDISLTGSDLTLSSGSTIDLSVIDTDTDTQLDETAVDAFVSNNGYITSPDDADADPNNEIQTISRTGTTVTLSNGGGTFTDSVGVYTAGTGIDIINNEISTTEPTYTIGLWPELGGYVFWVSADGKHGLVAETVDQAYTTTWYIAPDKISNPTDHSSNGQKFRDWRLPTKYELNEMYLQEGAIGGFAGDYYWSSSEYGNSGAWGQDFNNGLQYSGYRSASSYVRAVRAF